ncbi:MAG: septal ring lytic transglycosylase RlpA family protein [Solirubrobacterales bacterium]
MPAPRADIHVPRYTLLAALIAATLVVLAAACGSASADVGPTAATGGSGFIVQPVTAPKGAFAGKPATLNGHLANATGTVSITAKRGESDWLPVGTAEADAGGDFTFTWTPPKAGRFHFRFTEAGAATASVEDPPQGTVSVYRRQKATWYGPGFYGSRTACGQKLTKRTLGVAHKTLPCGTRVEFFLRGKSITVPVIDRGPYANAAVWDLTLTAMKRLGSSSTEFVGALPQ